MTLNKQFMGVTSMGNTSYNRMRRNNKSKGTNMIQSFNETVEVL